MAIPAPKAVAARSSADMFFGHNVRRRPRNALHGQPRPGVQNSQNLVGNLRRASAVCPPTVRDVPVVGDAMGDSFTPLSEIFCPQDVNAAGVGFICDDDHLLAASGKQRRADHV